MIVAKDIFTARPLDHRTECAGAASGDLALTVDLKHLYITAA
jgi:hypothetical protein